MEAQRRIYSVSVLSAAFFYHFIPSEIKNEAERAAQLKAVISSFPEPIVIVMRYLFAFLHQ